MAGYLHLWGYEGDRFKATDPETGKFFVFKLAKIDLDGRLTVDFEDPAMHFEFTRLGGSKRRMAADAPSRPEDDDVSRSTLIHYPR